MAIDFNSSTHLKMHNVRGLGRFENGRSAIAEVRPDTVRRKQRKRPTDRKHSINQTRAALTGLTIPLVRHR